MTRDRALHYLNAIRREVGRMVRLERTWSSPSFLPDDRIAARAEWANVMDRFSSVVRAHQAGQLDHELSDELINVGRLLSDLIPTLDRMQLRRPSTTELACLGVPSAA